MKKTIHSLLTLTALAILSIAFANPAWAQTPCSDDSECGTGYVCDGVECVPACSIDSHCGDPNYWDCRRGHCFATSPGCSSDYDCPGQVCNLSTGQCENSVCDAGDLGLQTYNTTVAAIPDSADVVVGNRINISARYSDSSYTYECDDEAGCTMNYVSQADFTNAQCGEAEGCFKVDGTTKQSSSGFALYHSHLMNGGSGKYYISAILGTCNGRKLVELTRCGCG